MRKKTDHQLYLERKARAEKGQKIKYRLVQAVLKNIEIKDFLETLRDAASSSFSVDCELSYFCRDYLNLNEARVIRPKSILEEQKIDEFLDQLYPYYNQKESALTLL
jgi:hypothetical protein